MPNRLAAEKSPYLLQHKDNPVDWYPWGEEAFARARAENKLIFLSIGYSTCYWCHVMEKDSFEMNDVAAVLNQQFISIKVDREERPDVDKIYMEAVVAISGHGGWPMSVFLRPDLKPVFGGTFFYRQQFLQLLERINLLWSESPEALDDNAEKLGAFLNRENEASPVPIDKQTLDRAYTQLRESHDFKNGGFGNAPKFPSSERLRFLLRVNAQEKKDAVEMVEHTLAQMARGGIHDQLGGGFHRYSTDAAWLVPHFEKMLYDNALLAVTYLEAYRVGGEKIFADVARGILDYVLREMTAPEGGFFSAQDAGEVGREGEYFVWSDKELRSLLTADEYTAIEKVYGVTEKGNFEHSTNVLALQPNVRWEERETPAIKSANEKLLRERSKRTPPHLDDKILTSWNGLMISAFAQGYQVFGETRYLQAAQRAGEFVLSKLSREATLFRRYRDGDSSLAGTLDDYAFFIAALLDLYGSDFNSRWLQSARNFQKTLDTQFWDSNAGGYFFTNASEKNLLVRRKDFGDEALPAGNSISALNLLRLYHLTTEKKYLDSTTTLFQAMSGQLSQYPFAYTAALNAVLFHQSRVRELVIVGPADSTAAREIREHIWRGFRPGVVMLQHVDSARQPPTPIIQGKTPLNGQTTFYVCEQNTCQLPTTDVAEAKRLLADNVNVH